uniref:Cyclin-like domain-containing protein n=1 Tax=Panagrolaimus sp. JU765 TaxID=591449 RepID=A0AC34REM9_9BILA
MATNRNAKREVEIRKRVQVAVLKKPDAVKNAEDQPSEFERDTKVEDEEDPEVIKLMEKIKPAPGYDKKRNYSEIVVGAESFLLSLDKKTQNYLEVKPSCLDGLTPEEEEDLRYLGAEIIETMVYLLKLPMIVGETACIFFQRFYGIQSFVKHPFEHIVMASVLLATKVEEDYRRPREIITVFDRLKKMYMRRSDKTVLLSTLKIDSHYVLLKNNIVTAERRLLFNLGFVCQIKHPHGYIFVYLRTLALSDNERLLNAAWASMNDCMKTDLFLRYFPKTIAAACIVRTCRKNNPEFELPVIDGFHWYEVFSVSSRDVEHIIEVLDKLYERQHAPDWNKLLTSVAEARKKKFGIEKVVKLTDEETKKAINEEEEEKKENGNVKSYSKKLAGSSERRKRPRSRSKERKHDKYRERDRKDRVKDYRDRDRHDRDRKDRRRSRSKDRKDERKSRDKDYRREHSRDRRRRSRSRSPVKSRSQKV